MITPCIPLTWLEHKLQTRVSTFLAQSTQNKRIRTDSEIGDICVIWYWSPRQKLQNGFNFLSRRSKIVTALHEILDEICACSQKCSLCKTQFVRYLKICIWQNTNNSFIQEWHGRIYQYVWWYARKWRKISISVHFGLKISARVKQCVSFVVTDLTTRLRKDRKFLRNAFGNYVRKTDRVKRINILASRSPDLTNLA